MKIFNLLSNQYFWVLVILLLGLLVRIYKIDSPIADWHSWRQADTAAVTRNFIKEGFNPFLPKYDDMSGVAEKPIPNPGRFRFVEFPIYNIAVYPFYLIFGVHDYLSRLVSVIFSLGSTIFLFLLVRKYKNSFQALLSTFVFTFLPFNVFFSRTTLPEPTLVFFSLGMIYFWDRFVTEGNDRWWATFFTVVAFLIKPWAIFFFLPIIYLIFLKYGNIPKKFLFTFTLSLLPFILWRLWILQQPEGIPASNWLLNGDGIRFRPAFWWWLISQRIGGEILGVTGAFLFFLGLIVRPKNSNWFFHFFALSMFLYMVIFATGNVRHNYYQIVFVPIASIFVAEGLLMLFSSIRDFIPRVWTLSLGFLLFFLMFYFTWVPVKELYKINNPSMIKAGKMADQILPKNAVIVAPYNGDTAFLYQTNRVGWAMEALPLIELVSNYGVTSYISTARDDKTNWVIKHFKVLANEPDFVIADLTKITVPLDTKDSQF